MAHTGDSASRDIGGDCLRGPCPRIAWRVGAFLRAPSPGSANHASDSLPLWIPHREREGLSRPLAAHHELLSITSRLKEQIDGATPNRLYLHRQAPSPFVTYL